MARVQLIMTSTVICPFYCGECGNTIVCEGADPDCSILVLGGNTGTYCQSDWRKCPVARMNWAKYDDLSNLKYMNPEGQCIKDVIKNFQLTEKQFRFCTEYLLSHNATQAYILANPKIKNRQSAAACASYTLKIPAVKAYLEARMHL